MQPEPLGALGSSEPHALMRRAGRTFYLASRFLSQATREQVTALYALCRVIDDAADSSESLAHKEAALDALRISVDDGSLLTPFSAAATRAQVRVRVGELIEGARRDAQGEAIANTRDLIEYAYRVAGTVGAALCPMLGADSSRALPHAVSLGIGMQLTNIARDVAEDAARGRRYLPEAWLGVSQTETAAHARVVDATRALLSLADTHYARAAEGWHFIPARNRLAVITAAMMYREIGAVVLKQGCNPNAPRAVVSPWAKGRCCLRATWVWLRSLMSEPSKPSAWSSVASGQARHG
jgi:15-cis-phytoene synthase